MSVDVQKDRLYYVSNRGVVFCLDIQGFRDNENDGSVKVPTLLLASDYGL